MHAHQEEDEDKPCRACTDFKTWAKKQTKPTLSNNSKAPPRSNCPLDKGELGRSTWGFLHTMTTHYPKEPTDKEALDMCNFFRIFSYVYPCEPCALDFQEDINKNPPKTGSRKELAEWLCERHNTVNVKLGKPAFDCSKVFERWKYGWSDGSCD